MSSRSPSPKLPQREASSPPAAPPLTSTTHTPPGTADSSLSALLELLKVPYTDALEDSQLDVTRILRTCFWEEDKWPRSTDMEIENENCTETESQAYFTCGTLDQKYALSALLGS
ncbi:hypothetical protein MRX96_016937 [Rhipicephalus microplus]